MKLPSFLFLFFFINSYAQENKSCGDIILYETAQSFNELTYDTNLLQNSLTGECEIKEEAKETIKQIHLKALVLYDTLLADYPDSPLRPEALFEKAEIEFWYVSKLKAKDTYLSVIRSSANNTIKHDTYIRLAEIDADSGKYQSALDFLNESKNHKKIDTCGTEYKTDTIKANRIFEQCRLGLLKTK